MLDTTTLALTLNRVWRADGVLVPCQGENWYVRRLELLHVLQFPVAALQAARLEHRRQLEERFYGNGTCETRVNCDEF